MDSRLNIDAATEEKLSRIVLVNQMIVGGLIAGVLFLTIMLVVMQQSGAVEQEPKEDSLPIVALAAAGVAAMATIARVFVGMMGTVKDDATKQSNPNSPIHGMGSDIKDPFIRRVAGNWTVGNIVRNAITEGAALFNGIAYMVEGQIWSIAIVGALIAWMLFGMPTKTSLKQRIEERQMDLPPEPNL